MGGRDFFVDSASDGGAEYSILFLKSQPKTRPPILGTYQPPFIYNNPALLDELGLLGAFEENANGFAAGVAGVLGVIVYVEIDM